MTYVKYLLLQLHVNKQAARRRLAGIIEFARTHGNLGAFGDDSVR